MQAPVCDFTLPNWRLYADFQFETKTSTKVKPSDDAEGFTLVDHARGNWNCVFDGLIVLCERLEKLGTGRR